MYFYGKAALDLNSINRRVNKINDNLDKGETDLNPRSLSGRAAAVLNEDEADVLITVEK